RESFLKFFASKGCTIVPSAPMVLKGDPTLMFTNAGMNQFKDIILGNVEKKFSRAADSQKCLRVSGKHNDLEEVGHDTYHHTMFEMLGNWSFGDYFKEEAITWAWEYLVDTLKLDPKNMYATVFEGSPAEGLTRDDEAAAIWERFLPKDHILNGNKHDNFWEMGDTGPCGPCSEIHYDSRPEAEKAAVSGRELVNKDHPQVIEIWNLVFMQYNRMANGSLEKLPAHVIDTGMGFERLVRTMQGKTSNYDTDVFQPIIQTIGALSGKTYGQDEKTDIAMRVIADHIRTIAFAITDGQLPSNAKAGYVIRRILRRAVRYAYTYLDQKEAFLYKLLPILDQTMGEAYPELLAQNDLIVKVIKEEEDSFLRTLENGIKRMDGIMADTKAAGKTVIDGKEAFTLFDTYGFPLDLTELIARENGLTIDEEQFNVNMQAQKERARNAAAVENGDWVELHPGTTEFVGYDMFECETEVLRYRSIKQKNKVSYQIVLAKTPFYGEMGGQVGDRGQLSFDGEVIKVVDTKRENNLAVHIVEKLPSDITAPVVATIDAEARMALQCNHTATHILDYCLRQVLGTHVEQKGSLVTPQSLRFDFSHFQKVTDEELRQVEHLANQMVRESIALEEHRNMPIAEAKQMGAIALFGEKYGDEVRVIKFGPSVELCGGCHVPNTGRIGMIRILSESSVAAGIRRIEAVTGKVVEDMLDAQQDMLRELKNLFNNAPNLVQAIQKTLSDDAALKKEVEEFKQKEVAEMKRQLLNRATEQNGFQLVRLQADLEPNMVKDIAFQLRAEQPNLIFVGATQHQGRPTLTVAVGDEAKAAGINASALVKEAAKLIQGGGGGQPHFAQAGGKNADGLNAALEQILADIK
nr:alanine--tRNA ligase [Bacteroidales bacterium]